MGGGGADYGASNYKAGYELGTSGGTLGPDTGHSEYADMKAGYDAALQEALLGRAIAGFNAGGNEYDEEAAQATYDARQEEERMARGVSDTSSMYSDYLDAAGLATDYITQQVSDEQSNAALLGIDYTMTDEMKTERINNYFSSIWGAGQQSQLEANMSEFGAPEGFEGFLVTRGEGPNKDEGGGDPKQVGRSAGMRPNILDEESGLGGAATILGGV